MVTEKSGVFFSWDQLNLTQWRNQWTKEPRNQGTKEPRNQWINEPMNQWTNEPMNQWINEPMDQWINKSRINSPINQYPPWFTCISSSSCCARSTWSITFAPLWNTELFLQEIKKKCFSLSSVVSRDPYRGCNRRIQHFSIM